MIELPQQSRFELADPPGSIFVRLNRMFEGILTTLRAIVDRHEVRIVDFLGGTTSHRIAAGPLRVVGVVAVGAYDSEGDAVALPGVTWRQEGPEIVLESFTGLTVGTRYKLHLLILRD